MPTNTRKPRVPIVDRDDVDDPELQEAFAHTDVVGTPPTKKLLAMAHNPELTKAFAAYWRRTAEEGLIEPEIKELGRIAIAQILECDTCATSRSSLVEVSEDEVQACTLPDFTHPDPRTEAALQYARTLVLDDGRDDECYAELAQHFSWSEIIELACFFCLVIGDVRMVKSFGLKPNTEKTTVSSLHGKEPQRE